MMEFLLRTEPPIIDIEHSNCCMTDGRRRWPPDEFCTRLEWAHDFLERWPDHVKADLKILEFEMQLFLIAMGVVFILAVLWLIVNYNRFARLGHHIRESWADIDVEMKRWYDLIPKSRSNGQGLCVI